MDELMQKLSGYLDAAEGVLKEYGPQAMDAALFVVRAEAIWELIVGGLFLFMAIGSAVAVYKFGVKPGVEIQKDNVGKSYHERRDSFGYFMTSGTVGLLGTGGLLVASLGRLLSFYNWLAAFDPTLGLVYKAAQSAGLL